MPAKPQLSTDGLAHQATDRVALVWFRQDLRTLDNPALAEALLRARSVIAVYVLDEQTPGIRPLGGAQRWWLHHSLNALERSLKALGIPLLLQIGPAGPTIEQLAHAVGARWVGWNRLYDQGAINRDRALKERLSAQGVEARSFNGALLVEPWEVRTNAGGPFKVFTPFWRAARAGKISTTLAPAPAPAQISMVEAERLQALAPHTLTLAQLALLPTNPDWSGGFSNWQPGEAGAMARLANFQARALPGYADGRDLMARDGTSSLSPHLHWGEIGPRQILSALEGTGLEADASASGNGGGLAQSREKFIAELGWREFSHHLLYHFPTLPQENFKPQFDAFGWTHDEQALRAWQRGRTGYPIVDAAMRQLWSSGWMHNRARMIVASFLCKHLLTHWRAGEAWFWDTLLDADIAANAASWQWVAGTGADAAPYFRIFNPVTQGQKFDPDGDYVRRWVPELSRLPAAFCHAPWLAPRPVLDAAGVRLGRDYPLPIVDHAEARARALAALAQISQSTKPSHAKSQELFS